MNANEFDVIPARTYATLANARAAVARSVRCADLRYFVTQDNAGRFFPIFTGQEALSRQAFIEFTVVA